MRNCSPAVPPTAVGSDHAPTREADVVGGPSGSCERDAGASTSGLELAAAAGCGAAPHGVSVPVAVRGDRHGQ